MAGTDLPLRAIREQIASALDLIVHIERLPDGSRKVVKIAEVQGMEGDVIVLQDLFQFQQTGFEGGGSPAATSAWASVPSSLASWRCATFISRPASSPPTTCKPRRLDDIRLPPSLPALAIPEFSQSSSCWRCWRVSRRSPRWLGSTS